MFPIGAGMKPMSRVRSLWELIQFYWDLAATDVIQLAREEYEHLLNVERRLAPFIGELRGRVLLDIGCGRLYPLTLLLHSRGCRVIGIDIAYIPTGGSFARNWLRVWEHGGLYALGREVFFSLSRVQRKFYSALQHASGLPLIFDGLDLRQMNAEKLDLPNDFADVVVSIAVFEHIRNVNEAVAELTRVLKPGGIAYVEIHLFTSLSGGHHPQWANPRAVPPWDHLRQRTRPVPVYLNRLRKHQYQSLFTEHLQLLEVIDKEEPPVAKNLLTSEIRHELRDYSEEDLLTKAIVLVARKGRP